MTLVFTRRVSLVSWIIRLFTGSAVSHVAIGLSWHGMPVLLHADNGGVQIMARDRFVADGNVVVSEYMAPPELFDGVSYALCQLGADYDYGALFGFIPVTVARWFGRWIKNPLASPRALICSELVLALDKESRLREWRGLDPERTTPAELLKICAENWTPVVRS